MKVTEKMIEAAQQVLDASFQKDYCISGTPEDAQPTPSVAVKALKAWEAWEAKLIIEGSDNLWNELGDLTDLQALRKAALSAQVQFK